MQKKKSQIIEFAVFYGTSTAKSIKNFSITFKQFPTSHLFADNMYFVLYLKTISFMNAELKEEIEDYLITPTPNSSRI